MTGIRPNKSDVLTHITFIVLRLVIVLAIGLPVLESPVPRLVVVDVVGLQALVLGQLVQGEGLLASLHSSPS